MLSPHYFFVKRYVRRKIIEIATRANGNPDDSDEWAAHRKMAPGLLGSGGGDFFVKRYVRRKIIEIATRANGNPDDSDEWSATRKLAHGILGNEVRIFIEQPN